MAILEKSFPVESLAVQKFTGSSRSPGTNAKQIALIYALAFICWLGCQRFLTSANDGSLSKVSTVSKAVSQHSDSATCSAQALSCSASPSSGEK